MYRCLGLYVHNIFQILREVPRLLDSLRIFREPEGRKRKCACFRNYSLVTLTLLAARFVGFDYPRDNILREMQALVLQDPYHLHPARRSCFDWRLSYAYTMSTMMRSMLQSSRKRSPSAWTAERSDFSTDKSVFPTLRMICERDNGHAAVLPDGLGKFCVCHSRASSSGQPRRPSLA